MSGPPKQSRKLKLLHGVPDDKPLPLGEVAPAGTEPKMPLGMSTAARRIWRRDAPALVRAGMLTELDAVAVASCCEAVVHRLSSMFGMSPAMRSRISVDTPVAENEFEKYLSSAPSAIGLRKRLK